MKINERNRNRYGSTRLRLWLYAVIFALSMAPFIVEMKTGIPIGKGRGYRTFHDPRSWDEVWTQLLELTKGPLFLAVFVAGIAITEWWIRFGRTQEDADEDANDHLSDTPAKPLTRLWLIATFGYMVALIALYVCSGSDWFGDIPLPVPAPFPAFAPVFVSLGLLAIYTGEVRLRYDTFYRSRNPVVYWLCVAMALSLGIFMAASASLGNEREQRSNFRWNGQAMSAAPLLAVVLARRSP